MDIFGSLTAMKAKAQELAMQEIDDKLVEYGKAAAAGAVTAVVNKILTDLDHITVGGNVVALVHSSPAGGMIAQALANHIKEPVTRTEAYGTTRATDTTYYPASED